jgi:TonB family protein
VRRLKRGGFSWENFAIALGFAIPFNLGVVTWLLAPMVLPLVDLPPEEMEVAFVAPETLDEPKPEPSKPSPPDDDKSFVRREEREKKKKDKPPKEKPPEVATVEPPKPIPVPVQPVKPPPPPPPKIDHRMQMVDQDKFEDEADNLEARFLAQKNHKTKQDTRTNNTNLIREAEGAKASSEPNDNKDNEAGAKDDKIAELENHDGPKNSLPRSSPMRGDEGDRVEHKAPKPGPLAMRDLTPRAAIDPVVGQKPREGLDKQENEPGSLPMARVGQDADRGRVAQKGGHVNLKLDHHNYDNIEGYDTAEKERRAGARAEASHKKGRYDRYLAKAAAMRSSIENFVFDVKPGNQAELGTRASPFAAYITQMHRQIHKLFTFGFLADIDGKSSANSPYNDMNMWTQLEIVLKGDGSVDKVGIVRSSGVLAFDVAAIDSVMSAAPFPTPPSVIKSANGKVYLDWQFHRDDRACGTFGVDPHILTTPGDNSEHDTTETGAGHHESAATQPQPPKDPTQLPSSGPRRLARSHEDDSVPTVRPTPAEVVVVPEVTAEVRSAAEGWFAAYARGDANWLAGWSALPFQAAGEIVARDSTKLKAVYKQLVAEAPSARALTGFDVLTPAGIRGRLGGLPPGGEESEMLFAVGKAGGEEFILLMKKSSSGWRVCGIDR